MEAPKRRIVISGRLLLGGLGCGLVLACLAGGLFVAVAQNLRVAPPPAPTADPAAVTSPTPTSLLPAPPADATPPALEATAFLAAIPSPAPGFFGDTPPTGRIAFACYVKQIDQICLMNADGSGRRQLTDFDATAFYPSLSADGTTVYFSSKRSGGFEIYSMDVNGNNLQRLTRDIGSLYAPELSPNGEWIVFTNQGSGLWLMRPDGKNPRPLTDRDDIDPTWSPDGSRLAFASSRAGDRQLFVMNTDGTGIRQVTNLDLMGGRSSWSPDGTRLAFYRGPAGDHDIYIIHADGSGLVQLTDGGDNLGPSWSPDGNWIAFTSFRDGNNEIYLIHPDGTGLMRVTTDPISDWQPRWGN